MLAKSIGYYLDGGCHHFFSVLTIRETLGGNLFELRPGTHFGFKYK
jgi:hypothetical protein